MKSLKQRLQDSSEIKVNLELDTTDVKFPTVISGAQPSLSDKGPQTLQQTSTSGSAQPAVSVSSNISKSLTTGQSATSDQGMEETSDKPGTEITITSTIALQASQDVEKAEWGVGEEGSPVTSVTSADGRTVSAASTLAPPVTSLTKSKETIKELPYVNADEPRLIQGTKTQSVDKMVIPGLEYVAKCVFPKCQYFSKYDLSYFCEVNAFPICSSKLVSIFFLFRAPAREKQPLEATWIKRKWKKR